MSEDALLDNVRPTLAGAIEAARVEMALDRDPDDCRLFVHAPWCMDPDDCRCCPEVVTIGDPRTSQEIAELVEGRQPA